MPKLLLFLVGLLLSGCASLNSVSLTPIPAERKNLVKTEKSKIIFLGFNFDNDFVDSAVDDLKRQCPNGKVTGLLTKDENIDYFLYIVWKKQITATGFCIANNSASTPKTKASKSKKSRGSASEESDEQPEAEL
jgi:uncharacterized lipoprotein YajG